MKLGMGLLNVATVANSVDLPGNPSWVGMADPTGGCLVTMVGEIYENPLLYWKITPSATS